MRKKTISVMIASAMVSNSLIGSVDNIIAYSEYNQSLSKSIDILFEPLQKENIVTFPNAIYTNNVTGFEIITGVPTAYALNGIESKSEDGIISSKDFLSAEDFTALLQSLELDISNSDAIIEIKVGEEKEDNINNIDIVEYNGHYYANVQKIDIDHTQATEMANSMFYKGQRGYLANIESEEEFNFIMEKLNPISAWIGGEKQSSGTYIYNDGGEKGKYITFFDWMEGQSDHMNAKIESIGIYPSIMNDTEDEIVSSLRGINGFLVEFGGQDVTLVNNTIASGTIEQYVESIPPEEDTDVNEEINSIDISKGLENAIVTSNRDYILGFKIEATSSTGVKFTYNINDEEVTNNSKTINFYDKYTVQEVQDILRSMKVESNTDITLKVTLGNLREGLKYLESTGHYYEVVESKNGIKWGNAKTEATTKNYLGANGYLAVITSQEENELISSHRISDGLSGTKAILLGASDVGSEGNWKWHNGEEFSYTNWAPGSPNGGANQNWLYVNDSSSSNKGLWDDGGLGGKDTAYSAYAVEYGSIYERLPEPTKNISSEVVIESNSFFNLGTRSFKNNVISFPEAKSDFIGNARLNIIYGVGYTSDIVTNYTLNGEKNSLTSKVVKTEELNREQMNEVLSSLTITGKNSSQSLSFTITIDFGQQIYLYNPTNGHYYGIFSALPSYTANKEMAESQEYLGEKGYIVTPMSEEEDAFLSGIVDSDFWLGIKYDNNKGDLVYDGGYKKGEVVTYEKGWNKRPNSSTPHAHANDDDANGLWTYCGSLTGDCSTPVYTIVEFGGEGRMPTPAELGETMSETVYVGSTLSIGDYVEENGVISFPNYSLSLNQPVNLIINYNEGFTENLITKYMLDGQTHTFNNDNISTEKLTEVQLKEVLDSLNISGYDKTKGLNMTIKIVSDYDIDETLTSTNIIIEGKDIPSEIEGETTLNLGKMVLDENKTASFPNAVGSIKNSDNLIIDIIEGYTEGNKVTYTLNNQEVIRSNSKVVIENLTTETLNEVLKSLKIESVEGETIKFKVYLESGDDKLMVTINQCSNVNSGATTKGSCIDGNPNKGHSNNYYSGVEEFTFNKFVDFDSITIYGWATPESNHTYTIYGLTEDDTWEKAGEGTVYVPNAKYTPNRLALNGKKYKGLRLNGSSPKSWYAISEILLNDNYLTQDDELFVIDRKKPVINNVEDKEYVVFDNINLKDGIEVIDDIDGNITEDINIIIEEIEDEFFGLIKTSRVVENIDNSRAGKYRVTYSVSDKSGNEAIKRIIVNVINTETTPIDLTVIKDKDSIQISTEGSQNIEYTLYRKDDIDSTYKELGKLENIDKPKETSNFLLKSLNNLVNLFKAKTLINNIYKYEDNDIIDKTSPLITDYFLYRTKEGNVKLEINTEDKGTEYTYKVEGKDENGRLVELSDEITKVSNISDLKGFVYIIDNNSNTEVLGDTINSEDGVFDLNNVNDDDFLHIKAIDNNGNESDTLHIKLNDSTYNNKPRLSTLKNKVLNVGDTFNPLDGVTAYDFEEGDLTHKITYTGAENVNTNKVGSYKVKYRVEDSKGLFMEETVTIHMVGTLELTVESDINKINLQWSKDENAVNYRIFRTKADELEQFEYIDVIDNEFEDIGAIDIKSPVIEDIYQLSSPKEQNDNSTKSTSENTDGELIVKSRDLASTYRYFVQSLDKNGEVLNISQIKNGKSMVDLSGYAYSIDNNETSQAPAIVNATTIEEVNKEIKGRDGEILHIRAIDNNGNIGETVHYLIGSKWNTNFIPVINNVKRYTTLKGSKIDLLEGVTASDYEDEDLTDFIEIESDVNFDKEGKYDIIYRIIDTDGNKREVVSSVTVVSYMNLDVTSDYDNNKLVLDWSKYTLETDADIYYEIRKYNDELGIFSVIGTTEKTNFVDEKSSDIKGAKYKGSTKEILDNGFRKITIESEDLGYKGKYQVFAKLKSDNTIIGTMNDLKTNEIKFIEGNIIGGVKGYSWHLSNIREDVVDNTIEQLSNVIEFDSEDYEWLHVAPIDIYGNKTDTIHISLKKELVDDSSNNIPVLKVEDIELLVGNSIDINTLAKAEDYEDGDLTPYINVELIENYNIDFNEIGSYKIRYSVYDFDGNYVEKVINLNIVAPIESINSTHENDFIDVYNLEEDWIFVNTQYNPMSYITVISSVDDDITQNVKYTTNLDISTVGDYKIYYTVTDSTGRTARFSRIVHVVEKDNNTFPSYSTAGGNINVDKVNFPTIYKPGYVDQYGNVIHGSYSYISIKVGQDIYNLLKNFFKAYDKEDGNLSSKIKISGVVNTIKPGWYSVQYRVSDMDGNTSYKQISVLVEDSEFVNPDGDKPSQNPDNGSNDSGNNSDGLPNKPGQSTQPDIEDEEGIQKPPTGNTDDKNDNNDIYEDLDGDGKADINIDTDGDGKADINIDTDGDGKADINIDTDGDGKADINIDIDGDGKADINIDTDGDGKADLNILEKPKTSDDLSIWNISAITSLILLVLSNRKRKKK